MAVNYIDSQGWIKQFNLIYFFKNYERRLIQEHRLIRRQEPNMSAVLVHGQAQCDDIVAS